MRKRNKGSKPDYIVRATTGDNNDFMINIGGAWRWREGDGFVVRLHSMPLNWDGGMILARPLDAEENGEGAEEH